MLDIHVQYSDRNNRYIRHLNLLVNVLIYLPGYTYLNL